MRAKDQGVFLECSSARGKKEVFRWSSFEVPGFIE